MAEYGEFQTLSRICLEDHGPVRWQRPGNVAALKPALSGNVGHRSAPNDYKDFKGLGFLGHPAEGRGHNVPIIALVGGIHQYAAGNVVARLACCTPQFLATLGYDRLR